MAAVGRTNEMGAPMENAAGNSYLYGNPGSRRALRHEPTGN